MKKTVFFLIASLMLMPIFAQKQSDIEKEKDAIKAVIIDETQAYLKWDIEKLKTYYVQDEMNTRLDISKYNYYLHDGWKEVEPFIKSLQKPGSNGEENFKNTKKNFRIEVNGNTAWSYCNNIIEWDLKGVHTKYEGLQICFLEKQNGKWKISFHTSIDNPRIIEVPEISEIQKQKQLNFSMNYMMILGADYAKSKGMSIEDYAKYLGNTVKMTWDQNGGIFGFSMGVLYNWESCRSSTSPKIEILEKSDDYVVIKTPLDIKEMIGDKGIQNISFNDLMSMYNIVFKIIAEYSGVKYEQKLIDDGKWMEITITK
jgi:hypothetical protein